MSDNAKQNAFLSAAFAAESLAQFEHPRSGCLQTKKCKEAELWEPNTSRPYKVL